VPLPFSRVTLAALADLDRKAKALTHPYFVLGAIARDVVLGRSNADDCRRQ
jgi:hypothetical protein